MRQNGAMARLDRFVSMWTGSSPAGSDGRLEPQVYQMVVHRPIECTALIGRYFKFRRLPSMPLFACCCCFCFFSLCRDPLRLLEYLFQLRHRCHFPAVQRCAE